MATPPSIRRTGNTFLIPDSLESQEKRKEDQKLNITTLLFHYSTPQTFHCLSLAV